MLRRALVTAEKRGMVSRNVAKLVDPPRASKHEITPLTPEQAKTLIETSVDDRHRALWITVLGTGLRHGELLGLRWEDVDLDGGRLRVRHTLANVRGDLTLLEPKTDRGRRNAMLPDSAVTALRAHPTRQQMERLVSGSRWVDGCHVFATLHGAPAQQRTIDLAGAELGDRSIAGGRALGRGHQLGVVDRALLARPRAHPGAALLADDIDTLGELDRVPGLGEPAVREAGRVVGVGVVEDPRRAHRLGPEQVEVLVEVDGVGEAVLVGQLVERLADRNAVVLGPLGALGRQADAAGRDRVVEERQALAKLTPANVQAFLNRKLDGGLSPRRVQYIHAVLRRALVTAERWGMVTRNVAKLVDPPRVPRHEITPLPPEQAKVLIEKSAEDRHRALWVTAVATGLRQGELLALRWEDLDVDEGRLRGRHSLANVKGELTPLEPKTDRSRRSIRLPDVVVGALRAHRTRQRMDHLVAGSRWTDSGQVFATMLGRPHHAATITRAFQDALARAGLPKVRFHDLRHSAATFLLAHGLALEDLKKLLGHTAIV